jgi:hypothetical protein
LDTVLRTPISVSPVDTTGHASTRTLTDRYAPTDDATYHISATATSATLPTRWSVPPPRHAATQRVSTYQGSLQARSAQQPCRPCHLCTQVRLVLTPPKTCSRTHSFYDPTAPPVTIAARGEATSGSRSATETTSATFWAHCSCGCVLRMDRMERTRFVDAVHAGSAADCAARARLVADVGVELQACWTSYGGLGPLRAVDAPCMRVSLVAEQQACSRRELVRTQANLR